MAASAQLLLSALSKPEALSKRPAPPVPDQTPAGGTAAEPDLLAGVSDPDSGLEGAGSASGALTPLTSEPPLADAAPLTSEPPLATELPLTSEPTAAVLGTGAGAEPMDF